MPSLNPIRKDIHCLPSCALFSSNIRPLDDTADLYARILRNPMLLNCHIFYLIISVYSGIIQITITANSVSVLLCFIAVECPTLADPANGNLSMTGSVTGSVVIITCEDGFEIQDGFQPQGFSNYTRKCQLNKHWTGNDTLCQGKTI